MAHDLKGQTFGRLTVRDRAENKRSDRTWLCVCSCGNTHIATSTNLVRGITKSCGCLRGDTLKALRTFHGLSHTKIHDAWSRMLQRCQNPNHEYYSYYGGRGIKVCDRWLEFQNFKADMGEPKKGMSLERLDNNLGYEPGNCVWATPKQQARNRRSNRIVLFRGKEAPLIEHCEDMGLAHATVSARLKRGWSLGDALTRKVRDCNGSAVDKMRPK